MTSIAKPREFNRLNTVVDLAGSESKNPWKHRAPFSRFGRKRLPVHGVEGGFNCRIEGQKFRRSPYTVRIALIALAY